MYAEEDMLLLSGIQHFEFCRRQWALIHIEQAWKDNLLTVQGEILHKRAHDGEVRERRGDVLTLRGLAVKSHMLGLTGVCDVVEFHIDSAGCSLFGEEGRWRAVTVEYKRGKSKKNDADRLQLCAQAVCLEEMLGADVPRGFLFYGEPRRREPVEFSETLRNKAMDTAEKMHDLYHRHHTPKVKPFSACKSCSLKDLCLSRTSKISSVKTYLKNNLGEIEE